MKRGENRKRAKAKNRQLILDWIAKNGDNQARCSRELGLAIMTVNSHFKEINAEKEQEQCNS